MTLLTTGPKEPHNLSAEAVGSIHDDDTATQLGFRAGTVAGDIHLEQFAGLCVEGFGPGWFENGWLSLYFENATAHREPVEAFLEGEGHRRRAFMSRPDGTTVAQGDAGVGPGPTAISERDRRAVDPATLRMLRGATTGRALDPQRRAPDGVDQRRRVDTGRCTVPLDWYTGPSPWGGSVASPLTLCRLLAAGVTDTISAECGEFVGLYGAIEIRHLDGPVLCDVEYDVTGEVLCVAETPKTEVLWFTTRATPVGSARPTAELTMMTRLLKNSSPLWG